MDTTTLTALPLLAVVIATAPLNAQPPAARLLDLPPLPVVRLASPIVLDGRVDDLAWQEIAPLEAIVHLPTFGSEPSERTEFRLAHDGENLDSPCRSFATNPEDVQGLSLERDETGTGSDTCAIYIDSLNDGENALGFKPPRRATVRIFTSPETAPATTTTGMPSGTSPCTQDSLGWYAEFRIPFSSLLLQAEDGHVEMGFTALRGMARISERVTHPAISPEWGASASRGREKCAGWCWTG